MEQIDPRTLLLQIVAILDRLGIPYLITGGMAVFVWGRPRFTADVDIVVEISPSQGEALTAAVRELGEHGYLDAEAVREAIAGKGEFNFIDGTTGVKVDFWVSAGDEFDQSRLRRRLPKKISDREIFFSAPEDLILSKLHWYAQSGSTRHLEDIRSILAISSELLDVKYLMGWIEKLDYGKFWSEVNEK